MKIRITSARTVYVLLAGLLTMLARPDRVIAATLEGAAAVDAWVRLKGDAAGSVTYEWVTGVAYGVPSEALSRPLFRFESVTVRQFRKDGPSRYLEQNYACRLYRDINTGQFIERFTNPLTNKEVKLTTRCGAGIGVRYSPQRVELLGNMKFTSSALGVPMRLERFDLGTQVVIRREAHSEFTSPSTGELRRETALDTFTVDAARFDDRSKAFLAPVYQWTSSSQWMAELGMTGMPGRMLWVVHGRNVRQVSELPSDFRAALLRAVPDAFDRKLSFEAPTPAAR
jgi:hypothetical protein